MAKEYTDSHTNNEHLYTILSTSCFRLLWKISLNNIEHLSPNFVFRSIYLVLSTLPRSLLSLFKHTNTHRSVGTKV